MGVSILRSGTRLILSIGAVLLTEERSLTMLFDVIFPKSCGDVAATKN